MKHVIIGTAGHIDHGKTSLIKALTGTDTDRLKEEKERGSAPRRFFASWNPSTNGCAPRPRRAPVRRGVPAGEESPRRAAAFLFFFEPVGVRAGERFDQAGFAVIDMAGG